MSISRRDYRAIAQAFVDSYADNSDNREVLAGIDVVLANVTTQLQANANFDANKFIAAASQSRPQPISVARSQVT